MTKDLKITLRVDAKTGEVTAVRNSFDKLDRKVNTTTTSIKSLKYALTGIVSALYINTFIQYADTYTSLNSQIRLVTDSTREFTDVQYSLIRIANDVRAEIGGVVDLYSKLQRSTKSLGYSHEELLEITEKITKAMIISGGSQESMNAAILQLGQGLASGTLRGEELNSVMEQTPRLAQAIADGMGVGIGQLRALAQEGKITSKVVIDAVKSQASVIDSEFSTISMTVSQALTVAKNSLVVLTGEVDNTIGISSSLAHTIVDVSQALSDNKVLISNVTQQLILFGSAFAVFKTGKLLAPLIEEIKLTSDAFKVQMALARMDGIQLSTMGKIALETSLSMKTLGRTIKTLAATNAPMLALVAVFEAWNYVAGESAKKERDLAEAMQLHGNAIAELTKAQALNNINVLQEELNTRRKTTQELMTQLKIARGRSYEQNEETIAIRAQLDSNIKQTKEIQKQIGFMRDVVNGTYEANHAAEATANSAADTANNIAQAAQNAYDLVRALGNAQLSLEKEAVRSQQLAGQISDTAALKRAASLEIKHIDEQMKALGALYTSKDADMDSIKVKITQLAAQRLRIENDLTESLSRVDKKRQNSIKKTHTAAIKYAKEAAEKRREYEEGLSIATDRLFKATHTQEEVRIRDLGKELNELGKYLSQADLAKIYASEINKMKEDTQSLADTLQDLFGIENDSLFGDMFQEAFGSIVDIGKAIGSGDAIDVAHASGQAIFNGLNMVMPGLGDITESITSAFSHTLSEEEIKAAAGRREFDSKFFKNQRDLYETYARPGNTIAQRQLDRLKSLDAKFSSVALALQNSSGGFKLDGSDFVSSESSILGGLLYASKTDLIGSGIEFDAQTVDQMMNDVQVHAYQSVKETSSFLGIFNSESIKESTRKMSDGTKKAVEEIIQTSFDGVAENLDLLGFDKSKFEEAINHQVVQMGKIDFKDMDASEQAEALKGAIGEMIGGAVNGALSEFADPQSLQNLQSLQTAGEEFTSTISRVAVGLDEVRSSLAFFGQSVDDFNQSQALIDAAGGLDKFSSGMQTFINGFFSEGEQKQYLEMQLQYALKVYDVALPASKEQFKALVLETQQKILSTEALIQTLKAEIAAKVEAGQMSLQAAYGLLDGEGKIAQAKQDINRYQISSNNALINSAHNAGEAAVGFGHSVNNSVKAMVGQATNAVVAGTETAVDDAGNIDYSRITSPAIQAAEASLAELQGLYGTLMNNMSSFSDYYGTTSSAASSAASALGELTQRLYDIASFKAELSGNKVESARIMLDATTKKTGLSNLTLDNVLSELESNMDKLTAGYSDATSANNAYASSCSTVASSCSLAASSCGAVNTQMSINSDKNKDLLQDYKDQYAALKAYHEALVANKRGFEDLQMLWSGADSITVANVALSRAVEDTKILGVNSENFLEKMNEAMESGDDVDKWKQLSDALRSVSEVYRTMAQDIYDLANHTKQAVLSIGAYTAEKQFQSIEDAINSQDYQAASSAFDTYVNTIKGNNALTQKEKIFRIADANAMVQQIEKTNPNDEVIKELQKLRAENEAIREELTKIEYNTHMTNDKTNDFVKVFGE